MRRQQQPVFPLSRLDDGDRKLDLETLVYFFGGLAVTLIVVLAIVLHSVR